MKLQQIQEKILSRVEDDGSGGFGVKSLESPTQEGWTLPPDIVTFLPQLSNLRKENKLRYLNPGRKTSYKQESNDSQGTIH